MTRKRILEAKYFSRALLLAPLIFICHVLEEAPTFVQWFNAHVSPGITPEMFWQVNISGLVITILVVFFEWVSRSSLSAGLALIWFSFLMFANAILHITGALVDRAYVPGVATAIFLYLPYYSWLLVKAVKDQRINIKQLLPLIVIGSLPMLVHGYLILFRSSRLF